MMRLTCRVDLASQYPPPEKLKVSNDIFQVVVNELNGESESVCYRSIVKSTDSTKTLETVEEDHLAGIAASTLDASRYVVSCVYNEDNLLNRIVRIDVYDMTVWDTDAWTCEISGDDSAVFQPPRTIPATDGRITNEFMQNYTLDIMTPEARLLFLEGITLVDFFQFFDFGLFLRNKTPDVLPIGNMTSPLLQSEIDFPPYTPLKVKLSQHGGTRPLHVSADLYSRNTNDMETMAATTDHVQCGFTQPGGNGITPDMSYERLIQMRGMGEATHIEEQTLGLPTFRPTSCFGGSERSVHNGNEDILQPTDSCRVFDAVVSEETYSENPNLYAGVNMLTLNGSLFHPIPNKPPSLSSYVIYEGDFHSPRLILEAPAETKIHPVKVGAYYPRYNVSGVPDPATTDTVGAHMFSVHSMPTSTLITDYYKALALGFKRYSKLKILELPQHERSIGSFRLSECDIDAEEGMSYLYYIVMVVTPDCALLGETPSACTDGTGFQVRTVVTEHPTEIVAQPHWSANYDYMITKRGMPCVYKNIYCFSRARGEKNALRELVYARKPTCSTPRESAQIPLSLQVKASSECITTPYDDRRISAEYNNENYYHPIAIASPTVTFNIRCSTGFIPSTLTTTMGVEMSSSKALLMLDHADLLDMNMICPCRILLNFCDDENSGDQIGKLQASNTFPLIVAQENYGEDKIWFEFLGYRSKKISLAQTLVNFVCHHVTYEHRGEEITTPFWGQAQNVYAQQSGLLHRFLPELMFRVERGTGDNDNFMLLFIEKIPTLCIPTENFKIEFSSRAYKPVTGSIMHDRYFSATRNSDGTWTGQTTVLPVSRHDISLMDVDEIYEITDDETTGTPH